MHAWLSGSPSAAKVPFILFIFYYVNVIIQEAVIMYDTVVTVRLKEHKYSAVGQSVLEPYMQVLFWSNISQLHDSISCLCTCFHLSFC